MTWSHISAEKSALQSQNEQQRAVERAGGIQRVKGEQGYRVRKEACWIFNQTSSVKFQLK